VRVPCSSQMSFHAALTCIWKACYVLCCGMAGGKANKSTSISFQIAILRERSQVWLKRAIFGMWTSERVWVCQQLLVVARDNAPDRLAQQRYKNEL